MSNERLGSKGIVVAYDIIENIIEAVTIHIISSREVEHKAQTERWRKIKRLMSALKDLYDQILDKPE